MIQTESICIWLTTLAADNEKSSPFVRFTGLLSKAFRRLECLSSNDVVLDPRMGDLLGEECLETLEAGRLLGLLQNNEMEQD